MPIPAYLPPNTLSIYGFHSFNGIGVNAGGYQFGVVDQMYYGAQEDLVGQRVLFKVSNSLMVTYQSAPYFLIQQEDIILTETELS